MGPVDNLEHVLSTARGLIDSVSSDTLSAQTPCTEWTVGSLIEHMIGVVTNFAKAFSGEALTPPAAPGDGGATAERLQATYRQAVDALLSQARAPGALDKTLKLP